MSIEEEENNGLVFESGALNVHNGEEENPRFAAVARVITNKLVRSVSFRDTMDMIWRPSRGVSIEQIGDMCFMLQLFHESDISRVLQDGPWSFDQNLVVISRVGERDMPLEVELNHAEFWVQIHNLPLSFMTETVAIGVGRYLGRLVKIDERTLKGKSKEFVRIRVSIDVRSAQKRRTQLREE
ncbi:unnamed protein product [Cuscuta epithymum]|uniref:DUF4283 domain-containing protein n=1 Tax=Cuscuta epithymum TaxID=186058 RepID=A0AAV0FAL9_9ASTE|nr:unnamed protein product [Cuscuta epithymum]